MTSIAFRDNVIKGLTFGVGIDCTWASLRGIIRDAGAVLVLVADFHIPSVTGIFPLSCQDKRDTELPNLLLHPQVLRMLEQYSLATDFPDHIARKRVWAS